MKKAILLCLLSVAIVNGISAKVIYCSSSKGDNSNAGISPDFPVKEIKNAIDKADTIYLLAGDTFYENLVCNNKLITKYGKGRNPVICGLKTPQGGTHWVKVSEKVWKIDLAGDFYYGYDTHGESRLNNIGCIYEREKDLVHGNKVQFYSQLKKNWDIWQTERFDRRTPAAEFSLLYLFLDSDPNLMDLSFSIGGVGVSLNHSCLQSVNVIGFGFGISAGSEVEISNCRVDIIGGMTQLGKEWFVNKGNGIEFYVSRDISNSVVHDCYVSRTYDSGITIQAGGENHLPNNIKVHHNLIENCCQAWEDFLMTPNDSIVFQYCEFYNNTIIESGTPGFTYPESRTQYCHVLGLNNKGEKGMIIRDNVFAGGNYYHSTSFHGSYRSNVWDNNICFLYPGSFFLCDHDGATNKLLAHSYRKENTESLAQYRSLTGDNTRFYVYKEKRVKRIVNRLKKAFLKSHLY